MSAPLEVRDARARPFLHIDKHVWKAISADPALGPFGFAGLSYWDALLWATALLNGVSVVLSEDLAPIGYLEGVRFVSPFD